MADVFLSYASEDRAHAQRLARALSSRGWSVWWDRTIPAGSTFSDVIDRALADARCVLVLWSRTSIHKNWMLEEAQDGLDRDILVPVLVDFVTPPRGFRRVQAATCPSGTAAIMRLRSSGWCRISATRWGRRPRP